MTANIKRSNQEQTPLLRFACWLSKGPGQMAHVFFDVDSSERFGKARRHPPPERDGELLQPTHQFKREKALFGCEWTTIPRSTAQRWLAQMSDDDDDGEDANDDGEDVNDDGNEDNLAEQSEQANEPEQNLGQEGDYYFSHVEDSDRDSSSASYTSSSTSVRIDSSSDTLTTRHAASKSLISDLVQYTFEILPKPYTFPQTNYYFEQDIDPYVPPELSVVRYCCADCGVCLGTGDNVETNCGVCKVTAMKSLFEFPLATQIKYLFEERNLADAIDSYATNVGDISDLTKGEEYKKVKSHLREGVAWTHPRTKQGHTTRGTSPVFTLDTPARAMVQNIVLNSGFFSCNICKIEGERIQSSKCHKIAFPFEEDLVLRTIDSMKEQEESLLSTGIYDLTRFSKNVEKYKNWKASTWLVWLLYESLPALHRHRPQDYFQHWLLLVIAINMLLQEVITEDQITMASLVLSLFVENAEKLYGKDIMSHNVHGLQHMALIVKRWGRLWSNSCFLFESFNGTDDDKKVFGVFKYFCDNEGEILAFIYGYNIDESELKHTETNLSVTHIIPVHESEDLSVKSY
ncbi:hypothetical protein FOCC_FOCC007351 [Frankliniella occidentalis]|nr:hypothetical protein FOCC_FOCC007351 [Frankliniella occidentalis]